jgi:hypothetical protein
MTPLRQRVRDCKLYVTCITIIDTIIPPIHTNDAYTYLIQAPCSWQRTTSSRYAHTHWYTLLLYSYAICYCLFITFSYAICHMSYAICHTLLLCYCLLTLISYAIYLYLYDCGHTHTSSSWPVGGRGTLWVSTHTHIHTHTHTPIHLYTYTPIKPTISILKYLLNLFIIRESGDCGGCRCGAEACKWC